MWNVLPKFTCKIGQNDCETWNVHFIVSLSCSMSDTYDHRLATTSPGDISGYRNKKAGIQIPIIWRIKPATIETIPQKAISILLPAICLWNNSVTAVILIALLGRALKKRMTGPGQ
jgi:hypothetical protein